MRYGVVRECSSLPAPVVQRRLLEAEACDVVLQEGPPTPEAQRRLSRLLFGLKPGDEVMVHSLDAFQRSTGELTQMIRNFLEMGVSLRIVGDGETPETLRPGDQIPRVLALLAEHESRRPSRLPAGASSRLNSGSRNALSKYQVDYARKLYREGASLRSIGLLFQVSPDEVWAVIGEEA